MPFVITTGAEALHRPLHKHLAIVETACNILFCIERGFAAPGQEGDEEMPLDLPGREQSGIHAQAYDIYRRLEALKKKHVKKKKHLQAIVNVGSTAAARFFLAVNETLLQRGIVREWLFAELLYFHFVDGLGAAAGKEFDFLKDPELYDEIFVPAENSQHIHWSEDIRYLKIAVDTVFS